MGRRRGVAYVLLLGLAGCNVLGAIASKAPKPDIDAAYKGLAGKTVGIMTWADKSVLMDWPNLQLDSGNSIINKLLIAQKADDKNLKDATFPYPPASFIKWQKEHPEADAMGVTEIAGKLGVKRLIYVEFNDLSTRAEGGSTLYLGHVNATLKILEVDDKGRATVAYSDTIESQFPKKAKKEGVLNANDRVMYAGVLDATTTEIVTRLIQHPDDSD